MFLAHLLWNSFISYCFLSNVLIFPSCVFFYPKPASIFNPVFFPLFLQWGFCRGESKDISFTSCQLPNYFLAINVQQLSSPREYKFLSFSINCCVLFSLPITKNTTWRYWSHSLSLLFPLRRILQMNWFCPVSFNGLMFSDVQFGSRAGSFSWKNMGFGNSQPLVPILVLFLIDRMTLDKFFSPSEPVSSFQ